MIFFCWILISCVSPKDKQQPQTNLQTTEVSINDTIHQLFVNNAGLINSICDSIVAVNNQHDKDQKPPSVWMSTTTAFTEHAPNILGEIAARIGDSTGCISIEVTVYNDKNPYNTPGLKNSVFITAEDAACAKRLKNLTLKPDSTDRFVYGIKRETLQ